MNSNEGVLTNLKTTTPMQSAAAGRRHWDEARIARGLRAFADERGVVAPGRVQRENRALYEICRHRFGGVALAAECFGLRAAAARRSWSEEDVLKAIRARHTAGAGLRSTEVRREQPALYGAACKRFGNWSGALAAAGAAPPPEPWPSDEDLLAAVAEHRAERGGPLPSRLALAIRRRHGSVPRFYEAHGLSARWTPRRVVAELRKYRRPPSAKEVRKAHPGFYFAALRLFPGWSAAIAAAFPGRAQPAVPSAPPPGAARPAIPPWAPAEGRWLVCQAALDAAWAYVVATPGGRRISCRELALAAKVTAPAARRMLVSMSGTGAVTEIPGARIAFRRAEGAADGPPSP